MWLGKISDWLKRKIKELKEFEEKKEAKDERVASKKKEQGKDEQKRKIGCQRQCKELGI